MTVATDRRMTLKEYLEYDDNTDVRYELVDGVLVEMGAENPLNSQIAMFLAFAFGSLGLPPHRLAIGHQLEVQSRYVTSRQPDLIVHSEASEAAIVVDGKLLRLRMPLPILVVEVVSNSDTDLKSRDRDYIDKRTEYAARGIPEYWIVDPIEAVVLVLILQNGDYISRSFLGEVTIVSPSFPALNITAKQVLRARL
jgi:Uma2 family endonuclease